MRLEKLKLRNFRSYRGDAELAFADLTALIGRNDAGKSSILEALAIFFDSGGVKFESTDRCVHSEESDNEVHIGCVFSDLPNELVVDATAPTTLAQEHLLNQDGQLEIHKVFECSGAKPKERIEALAWHPVIDGGSLLGRKNAELKKLAKNADAPADQRSNVALRQAIWNAANAPCGLQPVPLEKEDGKALWDQLRGLLPVYAFFKADRASTDEEAEIQDPMRLAIRQAMSELSEELDDIRERVREKVTEVAERTLLKLREFDSTLASQLSPHFRAEPKWDAGFKMSLTGDDEIPINKRGSGVRRLVLLSFFRAEAERRLEAHERPNVIYAVEEPETSQHPDNQRLLVRSFCDLSAEDGCQVVLTTHVPGLARLLPIEGLRYVPHSPEDKARLRPTPDIVGVVADALGVLPHFGAKVVVCVEGPTDLQFLHAVARTLRAEGHSVPDFDNDERIVTIPVGGSTLQDWVNSHRLRRIGLPEVHIYDRDTDAKYQESVEQVNARNDSSKAFLTRKREIENYLHADAIKEVLGVDVCIDDECDVATLVADALGQSRWKRKPIKSWLNNDVARQMSSERLKARGAFEELLEWFAAIEERCN